MNTDNGNDRITLARLEEFTRVPSLDAFAEMMLGVTKVLGMQHYVMARFGGVHEPHLLQLSHNAPEASRSLFEDVATFGSLPAIAPLFEGPRPTSFGIVGGDSLPEGPAGFRSGIAVARPEPRGKTVLMLGREDEPLSMADVGNVLSYAMLTATYASSGLHALNVAACPLSERELECLLYALSDFSAKETARSLGLGFRTVEEYLARARGRFRVGSSRAAAWHALDNGWITFEQVRKLDEMKRLQA